MVSNQAGAADLPYSNDYGSLRFAADETTGLNLLRLPEGFTYKSFGSTGDAMENGSPLRQPTTVWL